MEPVPIGMNVASAIGPAFPNPQEQQPFPAQHGSHLAPEFQGQPGSQQNWGGGAFRGSFGGRGQFVEGRGRGRFSRGGRGPQIDSAGRSMNKTWVREPELESNLVSGR